MCKQIVIARHVASELLKVRQEFMKRRRTEEGEHLLAKSCLLVQSAYRMRQGRQLAMVEFQRQWCCLVDCGTGACWYVLSVLLFLRGYPNGCCFFTPISFLCFFSLVVDCTTVASHCNSYYNLKDRTTIYTRPFLLHRGEFVRSFSYWNARGPTLHSGEDAETGRLIPAGTFWYVWLMFSGGKKCICGCLFE